MSQAIRALFSSMLLVGSALLLVAPAATANPILGDVDNVLHCAKYVTSSQLAIVNSVLAVLWNVAGDSVAQAKCLVWHTLCLNDGLVGNGLQPWRITVCQGLTGGGVFNYNNCYSIVHTDAATYYVGEPQSEDGYPNARSYWWYYAVEGWDYPYWMMQPQQCASWCGGGGVYRETNGIPGLQASSFPWWQGRTWPRDTWEWCLG